MKVIRHLIMGVLLLLMIYISPEIYKNHLIDFGRFDSLVISEVSDSERLKVRLQKIEELLSEGEYCLVNEIVGEKNETELQFFCSSQKSREFLKNELCKKEGTWFCPVTGNITISYEIGILGFGDAAHNVENVSLYLLSLPEDEKSLAFIEENKVSAEGSVGILWILDTLWLVSLGFFLLLAVIEAYLCEKKLFLEVALGYPRKAMVGKRIMTELLGFLFSAGLSMGWERKYLLLPLFTEKHIAGLVAFLLLDLLILNYPVLAMNLKKALGRDTNGGRLLRMAYLCRVVTTGLAVVMICVVAEESSRFNRIKKLDSVAKAYEGFAEISIDEETKWSISDKLLILSGYSGFARRGTLFLANHRAAPILRDYLTEEVFREDCAALYIPDTFTEEELALEQEMIDYSFAYIDEPGPPLIIRYSFRKPFAKLEFRTEIEHSTEIDNLLYVNYYDYPVFCFNPRIDALVTSHSGAMVYDPEGEYRYLPQYEVPYSIYENQVRLLRQQCTIWTLTLMVTLIIQWSLNTMILKMEHTLHAMELCLQKLSGMPLIERYERIGVGMISAYLLGLLVSVLLLKEVLNVKGLVLGGVFFAGAVLFLVDLFLTVLEIRKWENMNEIKILKGGAL